MDILLGGGGADRIVAAEALGADLIVAGSGGDEIFTDWDGPDGTPIDCGPGIDTVHGVAPSRVLIGCEVVNPDASWKSVPAQAHLGGR